MVKAGYKDTEVGVIPDDWERLVIGDVVNFSGGSQPPRSTFTFKLQKGYLRLVQIRDYKTNAYETYVPEKLVKKICKKKDVMIGRYGPPIFQILRGLEGAYNVALIKAIPSKKVDNEYLFYFLKNDNLFKLMDMLSQRSSGQTGVELPALKAYPLPLPPLLEQRAISKVLSDVDTLIASLDKLIAKKRAVKTAAMQQLLTGKTRLPGFGEEKGYKDTEIGVIPEDWNVDKICNFATITTGNKNTQDRIIEGQYPFFVRSQTIERINSYSFDGEAVLTAGDGVGTGKVFHYINGKFNCHQRVYRISHFKPELNGFYFFKYFSNFFFDRIMSMTAKSSVDSIRMEMIADMIIPVPYLKEQIAIAQILSDIDSEIDALQNRRKKINAIKQGMMQELLTGKTRLI